MHGVLQGKSLGARGALLIYDFDNHFCAVRMCRPDLPLAALCKAVQELVLPSMELLVCRDGCKVVYMVTC